MRLPVAWLLGWLLAASSSAAAEIEGVRFEDRIAAGRLELELHRVALLRYRWFFKVYVAALYVEKGEDVGRLLAHDVPRRLEIHYFYRFSAEDFTKATTSGVEKNVDRETSERLRPAIERFNALYRAVEPGDRYALTYLPGRGTELALNGKRLGAIDGAELSSALFSIWFGREPFDEGLKRDLLGTE